MGVGGLGHLAIQFAHALKHQVTAISSSPHKLEQAIALGADLCGIALPFLRVLAKEGTAGVEQYVNTLRADFTRAMFLTGCGTVGDLKNARYVLSADLKKRWGLEMKHIETKTFK